MPSVTITRTLPAPPERVFELLTDLDRACERIRAITKLEKLVPGPTRVGTRWRETRVMFGKEATEVMWVTVLEPPRRFETEAESHGCRYHTVYTLAPEGAGSTQVTFTFEAEARSLGAKLMAPLFLVFMGQVRKALDADFDDLERAAAGATAGPAAP
jgi:carbon monoxide dehydrogenase subunit G